MEVGEHDVDGAEGVAGADEERGRALPCARRTPSPAAAASSVRTTVVPTATIGRPAARVSAMARAVASGIVVALGVQRLVVDARRRASGAKVPGPTCSVTVARRMPRASSAARSAGVKCRPAVGAATAPGVRAKTVW